MQQIQKKIPKYQKLAYRVMVFVTMISLGLANFSSIVVYGDAKGEVQKGAQQTGLSGASIEQTIPKIVNTMLFIVGVLAVIMIIYGGIKYVTSTGDQSKISSAKSTIIYSVAGLIIAILAYGIVNFVMDIF